MRAPSGGWPRNHIIHKLPNFTQKNMQTLLFHNLCCSRGHRLIYIVKRNTITDGMGPFKVFKERFCRFLLTQVWVHLRPSLCNWWNLHYSMRMTLHSVKSSRIYMYECVNGFVNLKILELF